MNKPPITISRIKLKELKPRQNNLKGIIEELQDNLRSAKSKQGFKLISKLTILNPQRRDGGIMNCFYNKEKELIVGQKEVNRSCLEYLYELQQDTNQQENTENTYTLDQLPRLPNLSTREIHNLQETISYNKGITADGFCDMFLRNIMYGYILEQLWSPESVKLMTGIFKARLVPLNKVWPEIPTYQDFRPIAILSSMFKVLELRFIPKLAEYMKERMDVNLIGFVQGMTTHVNISLLISYIQESIKATKNKSNKINNQECVIFIDFKSAYNTIKRDLIYPRLREKNILTIDETKFLEILHEHLYFQEGDKKYFYKNGVHQGSPISPALFNIYLEMFIETLKLKFTPRLWYKAYADDLVFVIKYDMVQRFLEALESTAQQYNLKINPKKSAIMNINKHKKCERLRRQPELTKHILFTDKYRYLGVVINSKGEVKLDQQNLENRSKYLAAKMRFYSSQLSFENQYLIWSTYIKPYFTYLLPILYLQSETTIQKFHQKMRSSIKNFMGLPQCMPHQIFDLLFPDSKKLQEIAQTKEVNKIMHRFKNLFGLDDDNEKIEIPISPSKKIIEKIPSNFKAIFAYAGKHCDKQDCHCNGIRLTPEGIFHHLFTDKIIEYPTLHKFIEEMQIEEIQPENSNRFRLFNKSTPKQVKRNYQRKYHMITEKIIKQLNSITQQKNTQLSLKEQQSESTSEYEQNRPTTPKSEQMGNYEPVVTETKTQQEKITKD